MRRRQRRTAGRPGAGDRREAQKSRDRSPRHAPAIGFNGCKLSLRGHRVARILVIDDDAGVRESVRRMLQSAGYAVQTAATGEEGFELARQGGFDVVLSDMRMPGLSGIDVLRRLREVRVDASFIVMTGFGTIDTAVEAMKLGAIDFVQKPFFRDELLMRVRAAAERRQLARQVDLLQRQVQPSGSLDALVGDSPPIVRVKETIRRAAAAPGTVLLTGET
ncbi:MAG TPA: response regulator, partial [Vicinamibacterales bacterium]|nr:response regulator [Vicinamibacterales bacterium]